LSPDLATALRSETPAAPAELRERVARIAAAPPPPPRRVFSLRRVALLGAPAVAAASLIVAVAVGVKTAAVSEPQPVTLQPMPAAPLPRDAEESAARSALPLMKADRQSAARPAPTPGRAQDYAASLTVLVDSAEDLSATTQRALRATRRLGGYVVSVQYGTPEPTEGQATMRLRVPISRVQAAIVQFSELGRILAQQVQITDLQQPLDELTRRIRQLQRTGGSPEQIAALRRERAEIQRRAAFATVNLDLTTHEPEQKATPPSRFDRAVDDATGVLAAELAIGAYALIVGAPILLLLAAAFAGSRAYRRYADQRLLERA
jgi:Domain of unknown function (DUF4349)